MARYFARINKLDSGDAWKDYVQDVIADEYQGFRNIWVEKSFASTEEQKAEYVYKTVPELLTKFEALYKKYKTTGKDQGSSIFEHQSIWFSLVGRYSHVQHFVRSHSTGSLYGRNFNVLVPALVRLVQSIHGHSSCHRMDPTQNTIHKLR